MANARSAIGETLQNEFRISRVVSQTFNVYFGRFFSFTFIGAAVYAPLFLLLALNPAETIEDQSIQGAIFIFFYFFVASLATAIIVHAAFQHMRDGAFSLGASVATALRRLLPLVALSILWMLGVTLGFMLLIIPGFIVLVMWCVIVPCCVVEKTGPIRSFGRSRELTKGVRWKLLGLFFVTFLISTLLSIGSNALFGVYANFNLTDPQQLQQQQLALQSSWLYITYSIIFAGIYLAFFSVLVIVIYSHLRQHKEGVDINTIASVFD